MHRRIQHPVKRLMIEKMKEARDKNKLCAAVLTDLSKAFVLNMISLLRNDLIIS